MKFLSTGLVLGLILVGTESVLAAPNPNRGRGGGRCGRGRCPSHNNNKGKGGKKNMPGKVMTMTLPNGPVITTTLPVPESTTIAGGVASSVIPDGAPTDIPAGGDNGDLPVETGVAGDVPTGTDGADAPAETGVDTGNGGNNGGTGNGGNGDAGNGGNGDAGNGDAGNGDAGNGDAGNGDAGNGDAGNGDAGNGDAGNGGNGDADNGDAGNGGNGDAGNGDAGNGDAGNGDAGNGDAGNGDAGNGDAGNGDAGNGDADNGGAGNGGAGNGDAGNGGNGDADNGDAGNGGNGDAGNGDAGNGGNGDAGNGDAGNGGNGDAGNGGNGDADNGDAGNGDAGNGGAGNGDAGNGDAGNGGNGDAGNGGNGGNDDAGNGGAGNDALALDPANVQENSSKTGQEENDDPAQADSLTDGANFINFCTGKTLTNGLQVKSGSCNGIVMGDIPSTTNMVSSLITFPGPGEDIAADTAFDIKLKVLNLVAGSFTNPASTYYAAPQFLQGGKIVGHTHVTVQKLESLNPTSPPDPAVFEFFKGINDVGDGNGNLQATVANGLPAGFYRVCTMSSASNHQPVLMPVAQRGAQDDCQKFSVGQGGNGQFTST